MVFQHDHIYPVRSRDKYSTPDIIGSYFIPVRCGQYQRFFTFKLAREVDDLDNPSELNAGLKMCFINLDICNRIALRDTDLRSDLVKIKIPTVIMHGKKDKKCSFDLAGLMKTGISGSQIVAFENSGHSMFLQEMDKFNSELIKFAKK